MNIETNTALIQFGRRWKLAGDWLVCRECEYPLIASRDGEPLSHRDECTQANEQHPWTQLRNILTPPPSAESCFELAAKLEPTPCTKCDGEMRGNTNGYTVYLRCVKCAHVTA